ncbi:hypothetical protein PRIPAC_77382 [Pristionchus pacificus]|nr:hypothetical protein PRIPAC_77382 [Pristionchus pacificus]|eukprot:PDM69918.1 hypothetical protein PRIPAC_49130 [Pristionchus pacificus]
MKRIEEVRMRSLREQSISRADWGCEVRISSRPPPSTPLPLFQRADERVEMEEEEKEGKARTGKGTEGERGGEKV